MEKESRRHRRESVDCEVALWWADPQRGKQFLRAQGLDLSDSGVLLESDEPLEVGTVVYVQAQEYGLARLARVRRCTPRGSKFRIGLELVDRKEERIQPGDEDFVNYYELLQISSTAELETIHRVYRILVSRYHPDNPDTGDSEKFLLLKQAYEVLSDPEKRKAYDALFLWQQPESDLPKFSKGERVRIRLGSGSPHVGHTGVVHEEPRKDTFRFWYTVRFDSRRFVTIARFAQEQLEKTVAS